MTSQAAATEDGPQAGPVRESGSGVRPLQGVRVVDLSQVASGPYASSLLGDFGADVVKVEPLEGESFRTIDNGFAPGESAYFYGVNRSKRAMALDLKSADGQQVLRRLVEGADVFMVAFRPDVTERIGVDYETVREINPRIVYVSLTAFGESGPRAHEPGMDILAQAMSGMMGLTGEQDGGPVKVGAPIGDFIGSYLIGFSVCAALRLRELTGVGDKISINLLDALVSAEANLITPYDKFRVPFRRLGGGHPQLVPYQPFEDKEGKYFILACMNDRFWQRLLPILDEYDDFRDERFELNPSRVQHREELNARLQEVFRLDVAQRWLERFEAAGVPCGPINELHEALADPQVVENESVTHLEHPTFGKYMVANNPMRFQNATAGPWGYAPALGEHTDQVLSEVGYSQAEIATLHRSGVVAGRQDSEPQAATEHTLTEHQVAEQLQERRPSTKGTTRV